MRRLRAGKNAHAAGQPGARQAIDVVLRESVVAPLPGVAAIAAGEDRAVLRPREERTTVRLEKEGVDVLIGQRPVRDVPPWASGITLHAHYPFNGADQHLLGGCRRTIDRRPAMRESDSHSRLLFFSD